MNPSRPSKPASRSLWPYAIIAWFVFFVSGLATWAVIAMRQNMDLVRPDYYEHEIRYQQQVDRLKRTAAIRHEVSVTQDAEHQQIALRLPEAHAAQPTSGHVHFYRPSDARLDFERPLTLDAQGRQRIETRGLRPGLWKLCVQWRVNEQEFYFDQPLIL